jgi:hypothetical protein
MGDGADGRGGIFELQIRLRLRGPFGDGRGAVGEPFLAFLFDGA